MKKAFLMRKLSKELQAPKGLKVKAAVKAGGGYPPMK